MFKDLQWSQKWWSNSCSSSKWSEKYLCVFRITRLCFFFSFGSSACYYYPYFYPEGSFSFDFLSYSINAPISNPL